MFAVLLIGFVLANQNTNLIMAEQFFRRGMISYSLGHVNKVITEHPYEEDAYSLRASLLSVRGQYSLSIDEVLVNPSF